MDFLQLLNDQVPQHFLGAQNFEVLLDATLDVGQFVDDLLPLHPRQPLQLQLDDGLRLLFAECETGNYGVASLARGLGSADQLDQFIQIIERLLETEQNVLAVARLAQLEVSASTYHIDAVLDEVTEAVH